MDRAELTVRTRQRVSAEVHLYDAGHFHASWLCGGSLAPCLRCGGRQLAEDSDGVLLCGSLLRLTV